MPLQKKQLPRPSFSLVLHPEGDRDYRHFEGAGEVPFENGASTMSRANAWWLADSSLLAYWDQPEAVRRFADAARLNSKLIEGKKKDTQCYLPGVPLITEPLIDHTPRRYAVLVWNGLVAFP